MYKRILHKLDYRIWLDWITRHPLLSILLIAAVTACFGAGFAVRGIEIRATSYEIIVKDIPATKNYEAFLEEFGGGEFIQVIAKDEDIFAPETFKRLEGLVAELSQIEGVSRVISLPNAKSDMDLLDEWTVGEFREILESVDVFQRNIISDDKKSTAITLLLSDITQEERIVQQVQEILERQQGWEKLYPIGMPLVSQTLLSTIKKDFALLPPITFVVMVVTLILLFRSVLVVIPPIVCIGVCQIWTFGVMAWTDTPVTSLTLVVPVFLMAVGTAYCLHVVSEYTLLAQEAQSPREAAYNCLRHVRLPTGLAVYTTLIGLGSLLFNPTATIRDFAMPACIGMLSFLLLIYTLFPAILAVLPLPKAGKKGHKKDNLDRFLSFIARVDLEHTRPMLLFMAFLAVVGVLGILRLNIEADTTQYFRKDAPITQHFHDVYQDMSGSFPVNVIVDSGKPGYFQDPGNLQKLLDLQKYLESIDGIDKTMSFADYIKLINYSVNDYIPEYYALPDDPANMPNLVNLYKMLLGADMSRRFMTEDSGKTAVLMMMHISSGHQWLKTEKEILEACQRRWGDDFSVALTSMGTIVAHSNQIVTEGLVKSLFVVVALVLVIMLILFLSFKAGFITLLPNLFPLVIVFGLMGWLGLELSMNTAMIATIAIGLALDDTIHYMVRYNREFRSDLNSDRALAASITSVGRPIVFTTITISMGFFILMFSQFKPTAAFGGLMVVTMIAALCGDLFVLPSLIVRLELVTVWDMLRKRLGGRPQREIPLFSGLSNIQIRTLLVAGAIREYPSGRELTVEQARKETLLAILSGEVALYHSVNSNQGKNPTDTTRPRVRVSNLKAGDVIGQMLAGGSMTSWHGGGNRMIATTRVEVLEINPRVLKRLQWLYPPTAYKFLFNLMNVLSKRLEKTTQSLATDGYRDDVTGLTNTMTFNRALENEMQRTTRHGGKMALGIMEVHNMDAIVEQGGVEAKDWALSQIARLITGQIRAYDTMCRLDESRFAILLVEVGNKELATIKPRLLSVLERASGRDGLPLLDVSMGFTVFRPDMSVRVQGLMARATSALNSVRAG